MSLGCLEFVFLVEKCVDDGEVIFSTFAEEQHSVGVDLPELSISVWMLQAPKFMLLCFRPHVVIPLDAVVG